MQEDLTDITINSYNKFATDYHNAVKDIPMHPQRDIFLSLLEKNSYILDIGCGSGRDAKKFCKEGYKVCGIDLSTDLLKIARKEVPGASFKYMDIRKIDFKQNTFDGLWACSSLIHIPKKEIKNTLSEIYNVSKKGAIFYATVKKGNGEKLILDKKYGNTPKNWSFFEKEEMQKLLQEEGFHPLKEHYFENVSASRKEDVWLNFFCQKDK